MDEFLRNLDRHGDPRARRESIRRGIPVKPIVGDTILVDEVNSPWIKGPWTGEIVGFSQELKCSKLDTFLEFGSSTKRKVAKRI